MEEEWKALEEEKEDLYEEEENLEEEKEDLEEEESPMFVGSSGHNTIALSATRCRHAQLVSTFNILHQLFICSSINSPLVFLLLSSKFMSAYFGDDFFG